MGLIVALLFRMVLTELNSPLPKDFRDRPLAALDAVRNTYTSVAAARDDKAGNLTTPVIDPCYPLEVSEGVLGHS